MKRGPAFWDSSALNPLFALEPNSNWSRHLAREFDFAVWWATPVEIQSALACLYRTGKLDDRSRNAAYLRLQSLREDWYEVLPSDTIRGHAESLLYRYPLRAADALQLAAALVWCRERPKGRMFLCADDRLSAAAEQAGFSVLRP